MTIHNNKNNFSNNKDTNNLEFKNVEDDHDIYYVDNMSKSSFHRALVVSCVYFDLKVENDKVLFCKYIYEPKDTQIVYHVGKSKLSLKTIEKRASTIISQFKYNILTNNCHTFCRKVAKAIVEDKKSFKKNAPPPWDMTKSSTLSRRPLTMDYNELIPKVKELQIKLFNSIENIPLGIFIFQDGDFENVHKIKKTIPEKKNINPSFNDFSKSVNNNNNKNLPITNSKDQSINNSNDINSKQTINNNNNSNENKNKSTVNSTPNNIINKNNNNINPLLFKSNMEPNKNIPDTSSKNSNNQIYPITNSVHPNNFTNDPNSTNNVPHPLSNSNYLPNSNNNTNGYNYTYGYSPNYVNYHNFQNRYPVNPSNNEIYNTNQNIPAYNQPIYMNNVHSSNTNPNFYNSNNCYTLSNHNNNYNNSGPKTPYSPNDNLNHPPMVSQSQSYSGYHSSNTNTNKEIKNNSPKKYCSKCQNFYKSTGSTSHSQICSGNKNEKNKPNNFYIPKTNNVHPPPPIANENIMQYSITENANPLASSSGVVTTTTTTVFSRLF
ncbi:hypothetical protein DICPUDRAFT_75633 [Dictyostelium purpureum]|uniref:PPPDE domain-containing protein n=1 Tax=Dictyostelium purpureum TaxID=5786 RepID=F0ZB80_DICPU|nr:uncharacterized protein DICPUDRAFT_75633 [Dictyostelium purpureum]EGC38796.1 hypothetical protein DICPUDRAFT_75633 [Dictyostelium purpureum]|eukprot:XP_003284690.1 hypothetical protein DICPUDRAFT_75633 [Dictyostelium purpureum]